MRSILLNNTFGATILLQRESAKEHKRENCKKICVNFHFLSINIFNVYHIHIHI